MPQAKKNLTKAIKEGASKASETAVKKLITSPLKSGIKGGIENEVVPGVKSEAKSAANAEVKVLLTNKENCFVYQSFTTFANLEKYKNWVPYTVLHSIRMVLKHKTKVYQTREIQFKLH